MKLCKRAFALLLVLCLVVPMALLQVSAEQEIDNSGYKLFHESLTDIPYNESGHVTLSAYQDRLDALYNNGTLWMVPYASKTGAKVQLNYGPASNGTFPFDGYKCQKAEEGDWFAFKFKSPGTGLFSVNAEIYYNNKNNAANLTGYLLPARTAASSIPALLTDDNKIGMASIPGTNTNKTFVSARVSTGVEMEANKEYVLVLQIAADGYEPAKNRVDIMLTGLSFGAGYKEGEGAFGPVSGVTLSEGPIKYAEFYRTITTVHPETGNDLICLLFKGGTMMVYDIDQKELIDVETTLMGTPTDACVAPNGEIWVCGGAAIDKYDIRTGTTTRFHVEYDLFEGQIGKAYGITYGDDGYLYFGNWCWLARIHPQTGEIERISERLTTDPNVETDAQFTGYGGLIYKDGYLYLGIHGDLNSDGKFTSQVIKYDIANRKIVQAIDVLDSARTENFKANYGINYLDYIDGVLFGTFASVPDKPIYIDITGDEMVRLDSIEGFDSRLISRMSDAMNGKHYATGYVNLEEGSKCLYEYDPETRTMKRLSDIAHPATLFCRGAVVTVEGDEQLPGQSIVTPLNNSATGKVDLYFYNIQTGVSVVRENVSGDYGSTAQLHSIAIDPNGKYLYTGAYGTSQLSRIDLETGEIYTQPSAYHQIDGMIWYEDYLWIGNYDKGCITRYDPVADEFTPLFALMNSVFLQKRMWNFTAGDGKVFCGTVPETNRYGGVLVWYDIENDLTYVAAGPDPEDVYYADTTASFVVWKNAVTGEVEDFDLDGDGKYDYNIIDDKGDSDPSNDVEKQRFNGVVENQVLVSIEYVDGYIYGCTTKMGGQATSYTAFDGNANLFVYDVSAMQLIATYDVADAIEGLENPDNGFIDSIDVVKADPYEKGKFWSVVCDTLISFTFDLETKTFQVKEELSLDKGESYNPVSYGGRDILFDGDYVIATFHHAGTYMVNTADPSVFYQISAFLINDVLQLPNGDLAYLATRDGSAYDIRRFEIGKYTQPLVATSVQKVIDALPETVTMENEEQFLSAYKMYLDLTEDAKALVNADKLTGAADTMNPQLAAKADALIDAIGEVTLEKEPAILAARNYYNYLPEPAKALVTKLSVLELAEAELFELKQPKPAPEPAPAPAPNNTLTIVIIAVAAVVVIAAAVVAVILIRKKKTKEE